MSEGYQKNIGSIGGTSLLISSLTGPGLLQVPVVFQQAGWLIPTIYFILCAFLGTIASLFLMEAMTFFPENEDFGRNTEITVLVHHFYGRKWYYLTHFILYGSLQSFNIASIISGIQQFDQLLVSATGVTCGVGISPIEGWMCVTTGDAGISPFGNNYMLFTLGGIILLTFLLPLVSLNLSDNMIVQFFSVCYLGFVTVGWTGCALTNGINTDRLPLVGKNTSNVLGQVLFNYTLANTVPSWVNATHKSVNLKKVLWRSAILVTYLWVGLIGSLGFDFPENVDVDLLYAIKTSPNSNTATYVFNTFVTFSFPIMVYITSIPVSMIIVRLNILSSGLLGKDAAEFAAVYFPILLVVPFQTGNWLNIFANWTSLIFQTLCNFIMPFLIYIYTHRRNLVMNQSVLDELEFLDLGGISDTREEGKDYDFVYHLPHADESRIVFHKSFSDFGQIQMFQDEVKKTSHSSSSNALNNGNSKKLSRALDPMFNGKKESLRNRFNKAVDVNHSKIGGSRMGGSRMGGSRMGGSRVLASSRGSMAKSKGNLGASDFNVKESKGSRMGGSNIMGLNIKGPSPIRRGPMLFATSMVGLNKDDNKTSKVNASGEISEEEIRIVVNGEDQDSSTRKNSTQIPKFVFDDEENVVDEKDFAKQNSFDESRRQSGLPTQSQESLLVPGAEEYGRAAEEIQESEKHRVQRFHAIPLWMRQRVQPKLVAFFCILLVTGLSIYVLSQNIMLVMGIDNN